MRKLLLTGLISLAIVVAAPATAGMRFATYEGREATVDGQGGTKVSKDGVDFWTTGTPPRKYQILGVLTDTRGGGLLSGVAIGGSGVAAKITALGGNAAIVLDEQSRTAGAIVSNGVVGIARRNTTQLLVVKYLD